MLVGLDRDAPGRQYHSMVGLLQEVGRKPVDALTLQRRAVSSQKSEALARIAAPLRRAVWLYLHELQHAAEKTKEKGSRWQYMRHANQDIEACKPQYRHE